LSSMRVRWQLQDQITTEACENSVAPAPRAQSLRKAAGAGKGDTRQPGMPQQDCWLPLRHGVFTQPGPDADTMRAARGGVIPPA
jgi:hypothetical protein